MVPIGIELEGVEVARSGSGQASFPVQNTDATVDYYGDEVGLTTIDAPNENIKASAVLPVVGAELSVPGIVEEVKSPERGKPSSHMSRKLTVKRI